MDKKQHIIGLMSGSSLDGIDLCYCSFNTENNDYVVHVAESYPYDEEWKKRLKNAHTLSAFQLSLLDAQLASLFAEKIHHFINTNSIDDIDAIASHGHTVFHQPDKKFTLQIANGSYISALTNQIVISDFRSTDIALGGQGAPLVPIGDRDLFSSYENRVNLGGFANISYEKGGNTTAFDICPVNMVLNELVSDYGLAYDDKGSIARSGKIYPSLLHKLNALAFYRQDPPKSLGKEWYLSEFEPLLKASEIATKDKLRTAVEHISIQLTQSFIPGKVFLTGGGAHNSFLIERIQINSSNDVIIPDSTIVDFKEAIIFAYLGHLRLLDKKNVLSSVTGARRDHSAGNISLP